ncbi:MAG: 4Fe-4S dicluster domain-containing protein [Candidatus Hydrogenedens sp.]|nr:4Fe-4S dicluster domain-containing protein [Candidatus Hydrogenedens sp.]
MSSETIKMTHNATAPDPASASALLDRIDGQSGPAYWRSLNELAGAQEVDAFVHREFPSQAGELLDPVSRRNFLRVMGASMVLGGLGSSGCARQPEEKILPYVKPPEWHLPGKPTFYASAAPVPGGYGQAVLVTCYDGRPTHLAGLDSRDLLRDDVRLLTGAIGGMDARTQASILSLYDPDRLDVVLENGSISTWGRAVTALANVMMKSDAQEGEGVRILSEGVTSRTFGWQMEKLRGLYPKLQWHQWEAESRDNVREGSMLAFGEYLDVKYNLAEARTILSLDSRFLHEGPGHIAYERDFAASRDVDAHPDWMSRLYVAETAPSLVGAAADHKVTVRYPEIETLARKLAKDLGVEGVELSEAAAGSLPAKFVEALLHDLEAGQAVVIPGDDQPPVVHALAHAINIKIGALENKLIDFVESCEVEPTNQLASLKALVDDMNAGKVDCLVILGGNPVYNTPADIDFAAALGNVRTSVMLTDSVNETSWYCNWQIPAAHYLETWSDIRGYDGLFYVAQPMIRPLYNGKSAHEVLSVMLGEEKATAYDIIQASWKMYLGDSYDTQWKKGLANGFMARELLSNANPKHQHKFDTHAADEKPAGLDILFRIDPTVGDGRLANNGWMQELPKPLTNMTWDNAVYLHPETAKNLGLDHETVVEVDYKGRKVKGAVMYQFGQPKDTITVHLGYGRERCGHIGKGRGFNAYAIQTSDAMRFGTGAELRNLGEKYKLARTEEHWNIEQSLVEQGQKAEDRHLIREATFAMWTEHPDFAQHMGHHSPEQDFTLYYPGEKKYLDGEGLSWGMTIDLNKCSGCNVCVTACQSENNIPIVGKEQVINGREMQWIRVDRYYKGDFYGDPQVVHQPIPCMQCENAPCEPVCPVGATMHNAEGLNDMVYNRCVGTRYCANNCPYKVRRFNFFHFNVREGQDAPSLKMMRNPNVTVRTRGVMEKCTYCIQRVNQARQASKRYDAEREKLGQAPVGVLDGTVRTACQDACPSGAIVFGNLNDSGSAVVKQKQNPRNYSLIGDIGTRPRTTYLAKLRNPSPILEPASAAASEHTGH